MTTNHRLRAVLTSLLCCGLAIAGLAAPAPAEAATTLELRGRGYGHGIGMSQYGARDRAAAGHSYSQIVANYYPGTTLSSGSDNSTIRVRVETDTDNIVTVRRESGLRLRTSGYSRTLPTTVNGATPTHWRYRISSGQIRVEARVNGTWTHYNNSSVTAGLRGHSYAEFVPSDGGVQLVLGGTYREYTGWVRAKRPSGTSSTLRSVVYSSFTNYLASVVPSEMPSSWPTQALRAQAVAARTYARFDQAAKPSSSYYDTCDTTACQVFNGRADYTSSGSLTRSWTASSTTSAVQATGGRYLTYGGSPAFTQFSASNGGYSAAGSRSYLAAKSDSYDKFPAWSVSLSASQLQQRYPQIGTFTGVRTTRDGKGPYGGRVETITIRGTSGSTTVTGSQFRFAFGLRSTLFSTDESGSSSAIRDVVASSGSDMLAVDASGSVYAWEGTGSGAFADPVRIGGGFRWFPLRTLAHDLTGSGLAEIVYVQGSTGNLVANAVNRSGSLRSRVLVNDQRDWNKFDLVLAVDDWDGSGRPGFMARSAATGYLYYYPSDGRGGLGPWTVLAKGWGDRPLIAAAGDWDDDGSPDLLVSDSSSRLWLYPNTGSGGLDWRNRLLIGSSGWHNRTAILGAGDWDRDGRPDFLSSATEGRLWLHGSDGTGGQGERQLIFDGTWTGLDLIR